MPYNTKCNHKRCDGGPCKQLTHEELEPGEKELSLAEQLVREGWVSLSSNRRMIGRLKEEWPSAEELIRPELLDTSANREMIELWDRHRRHQLRRTASGNVASRERYVEMRTLSIKQYRAFRRLGGEVA